MVSFECSKLESQIIHRIAKRAASIARKNGINYRLIDADMDLTACHVNGCAIDLEKLEGFDDFNFTHDVFGIRRYLNRETGTLTNLFLPRSAMPTGLTE